MICQLHITDHFNCSVVSMGFIECNNVHTCELHPDDCRNVVAMDRGDHGIGMVLHVRMLVNTEMESGWI